MFLSTKACRETNLLHRLKAEFLRNAPFSGDIRSEGVIPCKPVDAPSPSAAYCQVRISVDQVHDRRVELLGTVAVLHYAERIHPNIPYYLAYCPMVL